ncbi:MAG: PLDc N-terminal domain-containing protein [Treponema sp.]|nr:PLDc N-terminal domain-containing protein [Treponema sp.]
MARIIFYSAQAINILFVIFVLFFERKESTRRFVWILLLLIFPIGGMVLYILFSGNFFTGSKRMHQVKQTAQQLTKEVRREQKQILTQSRHDIPNPVIREYLPLITMNLMEGKSLLVSTDTAILYTRGEDFFTDLCQELESAKVSIFMEYFIFHKDNIGKRIMEILCRKAREGVDVKLIYDDLGSIATPTRFFRQLNKAGGEARPFFQIRLGLPLTLNYRNHRKLTVIDSDRAFIGGINIGDEYENKNKRFKPMWRDTVVRLTGSSVLTLQINFLSDWYSIDAWNRHTKSIDDAKKYFPGSFTEFFVRTDVGGADVGGETGGGTGNTYANGEIGGSTENLYGNRGAVVSGAIVGGAIVGGAIGGGTGNSNANGEIGGSTENPYANRGAKQEVSAKEKKEHSLKFRKSFLESLAGGKAIPTQIVTAGPNEKHKANIEDTFIRMIMSARKNIFIQTPYFTPDEGFYTVLKLAAYTGVKIKIMIPSQWDKFFMKAASYEFARELSAEGAEFFLYPGFIHSKMMTVDGKVSSIGTTNIDVRSFSLLFEENAIFYDKNFTAECERIFAEDMELCRRVTKEDFDKRFILKRAWGSFCKLFSPLL